MEEVHFLHRFQKQVLGNEEPDGLRQRRHGALLLEAVRLELELHVDEHLLMELEWQPIPGCKVGHHLHRITLPPCPIQPPQQSKTYPLMHQKRLAEL